MNACDLFQRPVPVSFDLNALNGPDNFLAHRRSFHHASKSIAPFQGLFNHQWSGRLPMPLAWAESRHPFRARESKAHGRPPAGAGAAPFAFRPLLHYNYPT
jgi:hypothetical protein